MPAAITILTARAASTTFPSELVLVTLTAPDGACEYASTHYRSAARAEVQRWARSVGVAVEFSPGFPE